MKKIAFGSVLFIGGILGMMGLTIAHGGLGAALLSFFLDTIGFVIFIFLSIIGLAVGVSGMTDKEP
ncbi:MAG: hypothetical protein FWF49_02025 [Oscillospiraceae bacterium]|nr:hypothetical protein [Oscillospiraceae bacterium]